MRKLLSSQALLTAAIAIIAVALFNLSRGRPESDLMLRFNDWYKQTAPLLEQSDAAALSNVKLSVTISASGRPTPPPTVTWTLPARSLTETEDRENTARVLQLVSESGIFGLTGVSSPEADKAYLAITVKDGEQNFQITVSAAEVEKSIQLQNLLKLLDIFSNAAPPLAIEPART